MQQASNSLTEALREWFHGCPLLTAHAKVGVDYLPAEATEYAIYEIPSTIRYVENVLGEEIPADKQTQNFTFAAKLPYGADVTQNIANAEFYEGVVFWIAQQNQARAFPIFTGGTVTGITATLTAYAASVGSDAAQYQIQIRITYRRR